MDLEKLLKALNKEERREALQLLQKEFCLKGVKLSLHEFGRNMIKRYAFLFLVVLIAPACDDAADSERVLVTGWYHVVDRGAGVERKLGDSRTYYLDPQPVVTAAHFKTIMTESFPHDSTLWQVVVYLDDTGRERFARATEELIGEDLVFVLDNSLWNEPIRIQGKIPSGVIIISKQQFSKADADELRGKIEAAKD